MNKLNLKEIYREVLDTGVPPHDWYQYIYDLYASVQLQALMRSNTVKRYADVHVLRVPPFILHFHAEYIRLRRPHLPAREIILSNLLLLGSLRLRGEKIVTTSIYILSSPYSRDNCM